jgi:hypothetical protein
MDCKGVATEAQHLVDPYLLAAGFQLLIEHLQQADRIV